MIFRSRSVFLASLSSFVLLLGSLLAFYGPAAQASSSTLIWVDHVGGTNAIYAGFMARFHGAIVSSRLRGDYAHIDLLSGQRATVRGVLADLRARAKEGPVDLFVLAPSDARGAIELQGGALSDAEVRVLGNLPELRLVYLSGSESSALIPAFRAVGAQAVVARRGSEGFSEVFTTRFVRRWSEGRSLQDCVTDAGAQTRAFSRDMGSYLVAPAGGMVVYEGWNVDRFGQSAGGVSGAALSSDADPRALAAPGREYSHRGFGNLAIRVSGALLSGAEIASGKVPNADALFRSAAQPAWGYLSDSFPPAADGLPSVDPENSAPDEMWVDGPAAKDLLGSFAQWGGGFTSLIMDRLDGVRITRGASDISVAVYFRQAFTADFTDPSRAGNFALYGVRLPETLRFKVSMDDGVATISELDDGTNGHVDTLSLLVKLPVVSNSVYLRSLSLDLTDGTAEVNAGVLGDVITLQAGAALQTKSMKVEIWKSIEDNLSLLIWPTFLFRQS